MQFSQMPLIAHIVVPVGYWSVDTGSKENQVEEWIDFFLDGVIEIAGEAIDIAGKITGLREKDIIKIQSLGKRAAESACLVLPRLYGQPVVNVAAIQKWTGFSRPGSQIVIDRLIDKGILTTKDQEKKYGHSYIYKEYLDIFTGKD